jgi:hypothetical protein
MTKRRLLALLITTFAILVPSAGSAAAAPTPGVAALRLSAAWVDNRDNLLKYSYVILSGDEFWYATWIKQHSPQTKVLLYKSGMDLQDECLNNVDGCGSGLTFQQAQNHDATSPGDLWALRDASGKSLTARSYSHSHLANVGSASYQQRWVDSVAGTLKAHGFDGVFLDNALAHVSGWSGGVFPASYPSDAAWEKAMAKFVGAVGPGLKSKGFYVLANAYKSGSNDGTAVVNWWRSIAPSVSGLMSEYWQQNPLKLSQPFDTNPCCWTGNWLGWLRLADAAQASGADFFPLQKGAAADKRMMIFGKASFLLVWNGKGGGYIWTPSEEVDPWNPAWTTDVGVPTAPRYQVGVGWRRDYSAGTVLVNPHHTGAQTFELGGSYRDFAGVAVTRVTLQPTTALILTRAGGGAAKVAAPTNSVLPVASGSAVAGQVLTATAGSWTPSPSSVSYQWRRCSAAGSGCVAVVGANGATYTLAAADVGYTLRVTVTASNSGGSASAETAATATIAAAPTPAPPAGGIVSGSFYTLAAVLSGKCLTVAGSGQGNAARVQQVTCAGAQAQHWKLVSKGEGFYELSAKHSGRCLDVSGVSLENGAAVWQWQCLGAANQRWKLVQAADGTYELLARHSGKALDVAGYASGEGAAVQQWTSWHGANQRWRITAAG